MKKFDYYYSASHQVHMDRIDESMFGKRKRNYINGILYTEMIEEGKAPLIAENFGDDLVKVYTGTSMNIEIKYL